MPEKFQKHPSYGWLTKEEYEQAKNCGAEMTSHFKKLAKKREQEAKKQKGKKNA